MLLVPNSWGELQKVLFDYPKTEYDRYRSPYAYRGMPINYPKLKTSLMRIGGSFANLELDILRNFRKYANIQEEFRSLGNSDWVWLSVGQHYGLPTRLLDWTYSPYVALHFVTAKLENYDTDGVIWCVDYIKAKEFLPNSLKDVLDNQGDKFTVDLLEKGAEDLAKLEKLGEGNPFVVFLEPPSLDSRIVNQFALCSLMSNSEILLDSWLGKHDKIYKKIIIPAALKWEIRDHLDQANINERMLFPGLDGLCFWLRRHYIDKREINDLE